MWGRGTDVVMQSINHDLFFGLLVLDTTVTPFMLPFEIHPMHALLNVDKLSRHKTCKTWRTESSDTVITGTRLLFMCQG
jgi:hypothetical protein